MNLQIRQTAVREIMSELWYTNVSEFSEDIGYSRQWTYNSINRNSKTTMSMVLFHKINDLLIKKGKEPKKLTFFLHSDYL